MAQLSTKKRNAIIALMTSADNKAAANKAGVGYRTLSRWISEDKDFIDALASAEATVLSEAARSIAAASREAIAILRQVFREPGATNKEKIAAANSILTHAPRVRLLGSIEAALDELRGMN